MKKNPEVCPKSKSILFADQIILGLGAVQKVKKRSASKTFLEWGVEKNQENVCKDFIILFAFPLSQKTS